MALGRWCTVASLMALPYVARADAAATFTRLKTLVGDWESRSESGKVVRVSYRIVSSGTALVQSFKTGSGETLTVIHSDGNRLLATHYCAQGNQPRLRLDGASRDNVVVFRFADATNLAKPTASHLERLELRLEGADRYTEIETYVEDG
jgi:hypothetical protein